MRNVLLLLFAVTSTCFSLPYKSMLPMQPAIYPAQEVCYSLLAQPDNGYPATGMALPSLDKIKAMLQQQAPSLQEGVINKVLKTINCASNYDVGFNSIISIIDYSLPSSEKRLWVFDLSQMKLLFHTYVSHGLKSGELESNYFSNRNNSKASSIGVFKTEKAYFGHEGLSLRLDGLESNFNDNASNRSVVMHGGWYVDEAFIKKYGRAGRSWGCPAVPLSLRDGIINAIKDNSLLVVYYPNDKWFAKSKFLTCDAVNAQSILVFYKQNVEEKILPVEKEPREEVLFALTSSHSKGAETEPIVVMSADSYEHVFHNKVPLARMLRRQIDKVEYIALSNTELNHFVNNQQRIDTSNQEDNLNLISFVVPVVKMVRGYYVTEMHLVNLGKIKEVRTNASPAEPPAQVKSFTVHFEAHPSVNLRATNRFIRWLGL